MNSITDLLENLVKQINDNGSTTLTKNDLPTLESALTKAEEINNKLFWESHQKCCGGE